MRPVAIVSIRCGDTVPTSRDLRDVAVTRVDAVTGEPSDVYYAQVRPMRLEPTLILPRGSVWLADAIDQIRARTRGCVFAAVNAPLTRRLLDGVCKDWDLLPLEVADGALDLGSLGWPLVIAGEVRSTSIDDLCAACGVERQARGTALDEVTTLAELYRVLIQRTQPPLSLAGFSPDEQKIVNQIIARIADGRRTYGPWRIPDGRNNPKEALAEVMDALNYCAAELVRLSAVGGVQ
ncbi:MAG: hypothetical protein ACHREM_05290 [Polyangiales bacterium]